MNTETVIDTTTTVAEALEQAGSEATVTPVLKRPLEK